jgi:hypothetical protein
MNIRGIFIDDGRGDVQCINNVVFNCSSYALDSRTVTTNNTSLYKWTDAYENSFYTTYDNTTDRTNCKVAIYTNSIYEYICLGEITGGLLIFTYNGTTYYCNYFSQPENVIVLNLSGIRNFFSKNVFVGAIRVQSGDGVASVSYMEKPSLESYENNLELGLYTYNKDNMTESGTVTSLKFDTTGDTVSIPSDIFESIDVSMRTNVNRSYLNNVQSSLWAWETQSTALMNSINNDYTKRYVHLIQFSYKNLNSSDFVEFEFDSRYHPYHYKIGLSSTTDTLSGAFVPRINHFEGSSGYTPSRRTWTCELITAMVWHDSDNKICYLATFVDGLCEHRNAQGGLFNIRSTKQIEPVFNYYRVNETNDGLEFTNSNGVVRNSVTTSEKIVIKQVLCELPYYLMAAYNGSERVATNTLASKYPISAQTTDTSMYINGGQQRFNKTLVVSDLNGKYFNGILTTNGLYNTEGEENEKPTVQSNDIITYYNKSAKRMELWNGANWVNMDGTSLS